MLKFPLIVKLSGVSFGNAQANIKTYGSPDIRWFALVREPDNSHDPNAIRVALFGEFFMGYIPKDVAAWAWFATKKEAQEAETLRREELTRPVVQQTAPETPTDMDFLELVNRRLDHVKVYSSERHYTDHFYLARKWVKEWRGVKCSEIKPEMIESFLIKRVKQTSALTANKDLRLLRAVFNYAMHPTRNWIVSNPTRGIQFFPVDRRIKYVPPREDVLRVILAADPDTQDCLWTMALTMGRMSEINRLA